MTIRRDLDDLARQGVVRRIRGGALSLLLRGEEPPFGVRERRPWRRSAGSPPRSRA